MSWSKIGALQGDKVSLSDKCGIGRWNGVFFNSVGYYTSTSESYYRVRNSRVNASIAFGGTAERYGDGTNEEWFLVASTNDLPVPRDLSATYRVYGYGTHSTFGGAGSDFLMEYVHNIAFGYVSFKFMIANQGFWSGLNCGNRDTYIKQFFGTYGGISINLEYDI